MRKFLLLWALAFPLNAQSLEMNLYAEQFFSGSDLSPQNFVLPSLEDMLISKAFLLQFELASVEIGGGAPDSIIKSYGSALYAEFTNYAGQYGRSTCSAPFLVHMAALRIRLVPYKGFSEALQLSKLSKEDLEMALKKDPAYFPAYLGMAQWYLNASAIGEGSTKVAEEYLIKAKSFAKAPHQKYQAHVWHAVIHNKNKNLASAAQELAAAALIYPKGKLHVYISEKINL